MAQKVVKHKKPSLNRMAPGKQALAALVAKVEAGSPKTTVAPYSPGDTVRVHVRILEGDKERVQIFEGLIIARGNHGGGRSFTVRKTAHGVGVERIFLENSPRVAKLEVLQAGKVRRAKLYYMRGLEGKATKLDRDTKGEEARVVKGGAKAAAATKQ